MEYYRDTWDTYQEEMKTWAARVNWTVTEGSSYITLERLEVDIPQSRQMAVPVPTYDQHFPSLGGGAEAGAGPGSWKVKTPQQKDIMRPFIRKYYDSMRLNEEIVVSKFASKYAFHNVEGSWDIYQLLVKALRADRQSGLLSGDGHHDLVSIFSHINSEPGDQPTYLLCQHQNVQNISSVKSKKLHYIVVLIFGDSRCKVVEAVNELDQVLEITAKTLDGYVVREESCFLCQMDRLENKDPISKVHACSHQKDAETINQVKKGGNFKNFSDFSLNNEKESDIFLDGAVKISRTLFKEDFKFRARIARLKDFDQIVEYLHSQQNMVCISLKIFICIL